MLWKKVFGYSNYKYLFVIVTDTDGNKGFYQFGDFSAQYIPEEDLIAPETTNLQVSANLVENDLNVISVSFQTATDNVSTHANLRYYILVTTSSEAFADVTTACSLYMTNFYVKEGQIVGEITEGVFTSTYAVSGFSFNTDYYVTIVVLDEAGNGLLYTYATIQLLD